MSNTDSLEYIPSELQSPSLYREAPTTSIINSEMKLPNARTFLRGVNLTVLLGRMAKSILFLNG